jgi:hypothetical protein
MARVKPRGKKFDKWWRKVQKRVNWPVPVDDKRIQAYDPFGCFDAGDKAKQFAEMIWQEVWRPVNQ